MYVTETKLKAWMNAYFVQFYSLGKKNRSKVVAWFRSEWISDAFETILSYLKVFKLSIKML